MTPVRRPFAEPAELTGVAAACHAVPDRRALLPQVEPAALRIAQAALSNVAEHARASQVHGTPSYVGGCVLLDVHDDGWASTRPRPARAGGFGLAGMWQRVRELGGVLEVESRPGAGTAICVSLPAVAPDFRSPRSLSPVG
jgi:signal transduction histidine kinase